jgi:hypothetical protein
MTSNPEPLDLKGADPVSGSIPSERIADVDAARSIYLALKKADEGSSRNRSLIDGMFNGVPPFNSNDLKEVNQADRTNLDFGEAAAIKEQALAGYYDLTNSVDMLARVKTNFGTAEQSAEWNDIISEEFHRVLREWKEFEFNHQRLSDIFVSHGVGVCYFEDEVDWRYRVTGFNEFRIPRGTRANESEIEVATLERDFRADELYSYIRDPEVANQLGWDVKTVREALKRACAQETTSSIADWEKLEVELKNNDLLYGTAKSKVIRVVHMWVREFSGKVSHLIFLQEPLPSGYNTKSGERFLFKKLDRFSSPTNCFVTFTYGVGNGTYHGIRGLGYKIYPHIQVINRLRCGLVDGALLSSSLIVQPSDSGSRALDDLTLTYYGPYALFPPGLKIVDKAVPNMQQNILPVINDMAMQMQNNTGAYQTRAITPEGQSRTAFEVRAQLQKEAILTSSAINLFYHPWKRLLRETYRRLSRRGYTAKEPGGKEAVEFRKRCLKRGVPEEAIYRVFQVDPVRAIGFGSPQARTAAVDETMQIFGSLDEMGRVNLLRDRIAARLGQETVDRYLPSPNSALRPPIDAKIAVLENSSLSRGSFIPVSPGENHFIHAQIHLQGASVLEQATLQGGNDPQEAYKALRLTVTHLEEHVARLTEDLTRRDEVKLMIQRVQQLNAMADRIRDELDAQMKNAAKAQQAEAERQMTALLSEREAMQKKLAEGEQLSPEAQQKLLAQRAELQMKIEKHQMEMQERAEKRMEALKDFQQKREIADLQGAAAISKIPA